MNASLKQICHNIEDIHRYFTEIVQASSLEHIAENTN